MVKTLLALAGGSRPASILRHVLAVNVPIMSDGKDARSGGAISIRK
jgi:hypothetical protein